MDAVIKCPQCATPLGVATDRSPAVQCRSCGSTVLLPTPGSKAININSDQITEGFGPLTDKARQIARMWSEARKGNNVEAIRLYRIAFASDQRIADAAIRALQAGKPLLLTRGKSITRQQTVASSSLVLKLGCLAIVGLVLVGAVVCFQLLRKGIQPAVSQPVQFNPPTSRPASSAPARPALPAVAVVAPGFAHLALQCGKEGTDDGQFDDSRSVAVDGKGHVYVCEYMGGGRVQVFDSQGKHLKTWPADPSLPLINLSASPEGTLYVAIGGRVLRYEGMTGKPLGEPDTVFGDKRESYQDLFVARNGDLYGLSMLDQGVYDIVLLDPAGKIQRVIEASKAIGDRLVLMRIAADSKGDIFVMDREKGIYKFTADGQYTKHFMTALRHPRGVNISTGYSLAVDSHDRLFVTATERGSISVFDSDGRYLDSFGDPSYPDGIAIDANDNIYACYPSDHVIRKFIENPQPAK